MQLGADLFLIASPASSACRGVDTLQENAYLPAD
jgi:hypothetical protein